MITVITQPQQFSPANAAIFKISSDRGNILQFRVIVTDADSGLTMATTKYSNLPMFPSGTTFDLAPVLKSFIALDLQPQDPILVQVPKTIKKYFVEFVELYRDGDGEIVEGDNEVSDILYIFNSTIDEVSFNYYNPTNYVNGLVGGLAMFLNLKPLISHTYHDSINYLYFISAVTARVAIRVYKRPNTLLRTVYIDGVANNEAYRVKVSPDDLIAYFGDTIFSTGDSEFDEEFTDEFGSPANLSEGVYYTVTIEDEGGTQLSEVRTFLYNKKPCGNVLNVVWGNDLGGVDSLNFTNFKQSITTARTTIAANPKQLDGNGNLQSAQGGVFNPDSVIIASAKQSTFSIISNVLSDDLSYYAKGLVESENVLVQLPNGDLYPVQIVETNYDVNKRKINTANNRLSLTFQITDTNIKF